MKNITEMLNMINVEDRNCDHAVVVNTKVSSVDQLIEAVESALQSASIFEEGFDSVDVLVCVELLRDFGSSCFKPVNNVCFWFDQISE